MSIQLLIEEGENIRRISNVNRFSGECYERWKASCIIYMENNFPTQTVTRKLVKATDKSDINGHDEVMGILKAIQDNLNDETCKSIKDLSIDELEVELMALEHNSIL